MGEIVSLFSGIAFGSSNVFTRRGVFLARESFSPLPISIGIGLVILLAAMLVSGTSGFLARISWVAMLSLSGAGVLHFVVGRIFNYTSLRLIGANRAQPLIGANIIFAVVFGLIFLNETITAMRVAGVVAVCLGVVLIGTSAEGFAEGTKLEKAVLLKGIAAGLAAGLCYGISPLLIKIGLTESGSAFAGGFVSHAAAGLVVLVVLMSPRNRVQLARLNKAAFGSMLVGGTSLALGQVLRYVALGLVPINIAIPLASTDIIFVPILSFFLNRRIEIFSPKVLIGTLLVTLGMLAVLLLR